ncbi:hypothetical protein A2239_03135 [Candidatus Uhrbacteria bacterium RIFOXYA2_FULL_40_9]|nr:MAG: hypothetical protein UT94_C0049G0002 [Candidatus Uhrbacteria bacterium GW2011_GWF2_40_263]OGL93273.1 MAG: hypothetical protein A2239_03135 [Candidatus Uhrbacteria bacterium RIFOXYA2_FULL_40_9]OGL97178.1 MAG: hypothetical protein A2332_00655 [Candidatus Uhrbacteria bacterium RIFOXYB2_FULL_41_18]HBK35065.1 hypothetical protein [Candidatus Uhrbacteria bacterium]HCB55393.1 hypothetical protein [Candidatus Uhrbacteria bacterium]
MQKIQKGRANLPKETERYLFDPPARERVAQAVIDGLAVAKNPLFTKEEISSAGYRGRWLNNLKKRAENPLEQHLLCAGFLFGILLQLNRQRDKSKKARMNEYRSSCMAHAFLIQAFWIAETNSIQTILFLFPSDVKPLAEIWKKSCIGALTACRCVAFTQLAGWECYLPKPYEDWQMKTDVMAMSENPEWPFLAVQIKTGKIHQKRNFDFLLPGEPIPEQMKKEAKYFYGGTKILQSSFSNRLWIPIIMLARFRSLNHPIRTFSEMEQDYAKQLRESVLFYQITEPRLIACTG